MRFPSFPSLRLLAAIVVAAGIGACSTTDLSRVADIALSDDPLVGKFVWHDLITDDVQAARAFYGAVLGWTFEDTTHPNGGDYTLVLADGHYTGGMVKLDDPANTEYSRWLAYLSVPDVDRAVRKTQQAGGESVAGPLDLANVGRAAAIKDPQGAVVGLLRSKVGDPLDGHEPDSGHVVWNELLAADDAAALMFYKELADFDTRTEQRPGGQYHFLRAQGRDRAGVMSRPAPDIEPVWLTHFAVKDVHAASRRAIAQGGEVLIAPSDEFRNGLMALVVDPTGAVFVLHQWAR